MKTFRHGGLIYQHYPYIIYMYEVMVQHFIYIYKFHHYIYRISISFPSMLPANARWKKDYWGEALTFHFLCSICIC